MKVTKRGKTKNEKKWKGSCRNCESEAVATEAEMNNIIFDQREGGSFSWEICPVCSGGRGMLFYPITDNQNQ